MWSPEEPMSPPNPKLAKPIKFVELRITFKTDRQTAHRLRDLIPNTKPTSGGCEIVVKGQSPGEAAEMAKASLERVRRYIESPERL
jgi:hypothetical protein